MMVMDHDIRTLPTWAQNIITSQNEMIRALSDEVVRLREEKKRYFEEL